MNKSIKLHVDQKLFTAAERALKEKGTTFENWVNLQLRYLGNSFVGPLGLEDKMLFGKYAGAKVEEVVRADTRYMVWVLSNYSHKYASDVKRLTQQLADESEEIPF